MVMVAKTCRGAEFCIVFEEPESTDIVHQEGEPLYSAGFD
jgi:hypothetical protein